MKRLSPGLIIGILLAVFFAGSFIIRTVLPWHQVFGGQVVRYTSVDGYYYMRLVDTMAHNFPHFTSFDPFNIFPGGRAIPHLGYFYQVLAFFIWLVGLGHPSEHLINTLGALFPPFLAALTVIPVYFIGKTLFNRWVGVIAAALMAILPGEYMGRSVLGFTDTPVIETFFTTTAIAFLVLAVKTAAERDLSLSHLVKMDRAVFLRPVVYAVLAGIFLGFYLGTWLGALLFVFIITLYLAAQFIIDHLRGRSTEYLGIVGFLLFLVAGVIYLPVSRGLSMTMAVVISILVPVFLAALSRFLAGRGLRTFYYPLGVVVVAAVLVGLVFAVSSRAAGLMFSAFSIFKPVGNTATTTMEMQPFLSPQGSFSTAVAWGNFTTSFFLFPDWPIPGFAFIALVIMAVLYFKRRRFGDNLLPLLFIWTIVMLVLTLVQRRFAYYFVVNVALLSGWLSWQAVWPGLRRQEKPAAQPEEAAAKKQLAAAAVTRSARRKAEENARSRRRRRRHAAAGSSNLRVLTGAIAVVVFLVVFLPNIFEAKDVAASPAYGPTDAWEESLTWMKDNTPEPLGSPQAYFDLYQPGYVYPASAYGVSSWWDYGYWITYIAHRIPSANPSQDAGPITNIADLFLATDNATANRLMATLKSKYIVGDYATATSKFWAIATWAGEPQSKYLPVYYVQQGNNIVSVQLYSVDYFHTLFVRLYNFGGQAVTTVKPIVVTYATQKNSAGQSYRLVTATQSFDSYQAAEDFVQKNGASTHDIISTSAFISPVPLDPVPGFKQVFASTNRQSPSGASPVSEVKVFEYTGP